MIELKRNFLYKLAINATSVTLKDKLLLTQFNSFRGETPFGMKSSIGHTILIDLTQSEEELMKDCKSNTRNEIRRAIREEFFFSEVTSLEEFLDFFNLFAEEKGIDKITKEHLTQYGDKIVLFKSGKDNVTMTMHASAIDVEAGMAILLYSASARLRDNIDRKDIGFSNRFLHYKEFIEFKNRGLKTYDFNGICIDPEDKERYSISQFKAGFGGKQTEVKWLFSYPFVVVSKFKSLFNR